MDVTLSLLFQLLISFGVLTCCFCLLIVLSLLFLKFFVICVMFFTCFDLIFIVFVGLIVECYVVSFCCVSAFASDYFGNVLACWRCCIVSVVFDLFLY